MRDRVWDRIKRTTWNPMDPHNDRRNLQQHKKHQTPIWPNKDRKRETARDQYRAPFRQNKTRQIHLCKIHHLASHVDNKRIKLRQISSISNPHDAITKPLGPQKFQTHITKNASTPYIEAGHPQLTLHIQKHPDCNVTYPQELCIPLWHYEYSYLTFHTCT